MCGEDEGDDTEDDCLPFGPPASIIAPESQKAGKMGNDHCMSVGIGLFTIDITRLGSSGLVAQTVEPCTHGVENTGATGRLAVMNLALRGIEADFGPEHADTFRRDLHPALRADYVLANPPFNDSDWFRKDDDVRWQFGVPPKGNANFAWVQHFIHHLAPHGMAGLNAVRKDLANSSMSSNQSGEGDIRRALIEATSWTAWSPSPASSSTARFLEKTKSYVHSTLFCHAAPYRNAAHMGEIR